MKTVYLCGPINGLTYEQARNGWRKDVGDALADVGISSLSPMRYKNHLKDMGVLDKHGVADSVLSCPKGITARDRYDTQRCDLVFCNLLGAKVVSIGSMIEFGWCDSMRIPLVLVMEHEGNIHDHAMVREMANFIVPTVEEGIEVTKAILLGGV